MNLDRFIEKWRASTRTEKSASQEHFLDLCELLEVKKPAEVDPHGEIFTFEKSALKLGGGTGFADVWKKDCFAWEYKGDKRNLVAAFSQLKEYAGALGNPPLLIVSDMKEIRVHTNFTGAISEQVSIQLPDLADSTIRRKLAYAFTDPEKWRPTITREGVTTEAAKAFGEIARKLRDRGYEPRQVAHFLNRIVFCLFVEDIELLPGRVFADVLEESLDRADDFAPMLGDLFRAMKDRDGRFGIHAIPWFNGGLFDDDDVLPLNHLQIKDLAEAARLDWSAIEPSIFGTLFELALNPDRRKEMASLFDGAAPEAPRPQRGLFDKGAPDKGVGIHYTDPQTIMKIVEPAVLRPLRAEWEEIKTKVRAHRAAKAAAKIDSVRTRHENDARDLYLKFRQKLGRFRVLDPACGSGNFLYLSLWHLKDFDLQVIREAGDLGLPNDDQRVGPDVVLGIEINPYAAELARVTIWIGELQWQMRNSFGIKRRPILGALDGIVCRDALLTSDGKEAKWPAADAIVGNPPFLGGKRMKTALKDDYVEKLFEIYDGRVPAEADLVCYWFLKAKELIETGNARCFGLVATNSIRGGANRKVLQAIRERLTIFDTWDDQEWVIDGAAVRVSLVCVAAPDDSYAGPDRPRLNGANVEEIFADLTARRGASGVDLTRAIRLRENMDVAFMGDTKGGAFDIPGDLARDWLRAPLNPNRRPNADVLKPWINGMDVTRRPRNMWIVDFGWRMTEAEAALYQLPFGYVRTQVLPEREKNRRDSYRERWWRHVEPRPAMWEALRAIACYIATPTIAKHRLFVWCPTTVCPDHQLIVTARDDDTTFGILHSRFHEAWALRLGTSLEDRPRYTPSTTFETFPFPEGLTPNVPAAKYADDPRAKRIAEAARRLNELRENWLNPPDLVKRVPEVVPGFPDRVMPVSENAAATLKGRTLTKLYNERPAWLDHAHRDLDAAVAAAYGWSADISDEEALRRLFELNQARAKAGTQKEAAGKPKAKPATEPTRAKSERNPAAKAAPKSAPRKSRMARRPRT